MGNDKTIKTADEIELLAEGGKILGQILARTAAMVAPGVTTGELNDYAHAEILKAGGTPSFLGYGEKDNPFPASLCVSVNDEIVHGIPLPTRVLVEGDIVGLDIGMKYKGLFTDTAVTVPAGKVSAIAQKVMDVTRQSLHLAINAAKPGVRMGDLGHIMQKHAEDAGFSVVREMVGHGVGYEVHEDPQVPGYGNPGTGVVLRPGLVIAIEPMVLEGKRHVEFDDDDGWTIRTRDGKLAAHFEHTIAITETGHRILT